VGASGEQVTVEQLALEYYATPDGGGWQGAHWQACNADVPHCADISQVQLGVRSLNSM
jgi:hypothetical protein